MIGTAPDDLVPIGKFQKILLYILETALESELFKSSKNVFFSLLVQLYTTTFNNDTGDLQTLLVNKELVERGGALWVEHSVIA